MLMPYISSFGFWLELQLSQHHFYTGMDGVSVLFCKRQNLQRSNNLQPEVEKKSWDDGQPAMVLFGFLAFLGWVESEDDDMIM